MTKLAHRQGISHAREARAMNNKIKRRDFVKLAGVAGLTAATPAVGSGAATAAYQIEGLPDRSRELGSQQCLRKLDEQEGNDMKARTEETGRHSNYSVFALVLFASLLVLARAGQAAAQVTVFTNVRIFDGKSGSLSAPRNVLI